MDNTHLCIKNLFNLDNTSSSSYPTWVRQNGSHTGQADKPFCHQWGSDKIIHHQHSQVHPWSGFQEACPSGTQRDPEICHEEGDEYSRSALWHQAQPSCLDQRNKEYPILYPVWLSRKYNEDEETSNKFYMLVTMCLSPLSKIYS